MSNLYKDVKQGLNQAIQMRKEIDHMRSNDVVEEIRRYRIVICPYCEHKYTWLVQAEDGVVWKDELKKVVARRSRCPKCDIKFGVAAELEGIIEDTLDSEYIRSLEMKLT